MDRRRLILLPCLAALALAAPAQAREPLLHRFLAVDNGQNRLLLVDQREPARGWAIDIPPGSRDLQLVGADRVLVSHGSGAAEYALADGRKLWSVTGYRNVQTARRLPDGRTVLGADTQTGIELYTVRADGTETARLAVPDLQELRLLRVLPDGNFLLTAAAPFRVLELRPDGQVAWSAKLPGKGYKAIRMDNGHTLATTGNHVSCVELAPDGRIVRAVGGKGAHPQAGLDFFSGFDCLPNGNIVACNWLGHQKWGTGPHLVEFDRDNRLVWQWADHHAARQITNVLILDRPRPSPPPEDAPGTE